MLQYVDEKSLSREEQQWEAQSEYGQTLNSKYMLANHRTTFDADDDGPSATDELLALNGNG